MNKKHAAIAVAAAGLALSSIGAVAKGPGGGAGHGMHAFFRSHLLAHHHFHHHNFARRNFNNGFFSGGYYALPPYDTDSNNAQNEQAPPIVIYARDYPPRVTCEKYRETVKVPSESGGTRDITVTRC